MVFKRRLGLKMDRITKALQQAKQNVGHTKNVRASTPEEVVTSEDRYPSARSVLLKEDVLNENRIFLGGDGAIADSYGLLRTRVLNIMRKNNWKTLGITGPDPSIGKTVTSINLALSIAQDHNYSILLVDADLRRPGVATALGFEVEHGLSDFLLKDKELSEVLVNPQIEHFVIAPTKHVSSGSSELLSSPRMSRFIREAKERYPERLVLFDLPPVLVGDDVIALSQNLDALLLVVGDGKTQRRDLTRALALLEDVNVLGVVLNMGTAAENQYEYYK